MANSLYHPNKIKEQVAKHKFHFSKSLGQNFLTDLNVIEKILDGAKIEKDNLVIEIGPGSGVLTEQISKRAKKVIAIEIDNRLIPMLKENLDAYDNVEIINEDILKFNLEKMISNKISQGKYSAVKVIGNLPYYITTPIIMGLIEQELPIQSITIMMQKEVAERILAKPGTKAYGALSVAVQYYCDVEKIVTVSKEVFIPKPKVDSEVIRLDIKKDKDIDIANTKEFFKVVKAGFGMRRKTLLNSLTAIEGLNKEQIKKALERAGIDYSRRAETLTINEFADLSREIEKIKDK